ncbi:hypothetical protein [Halobacillus litoralis]|uniref:Uncharacterized protein n=1 Tax=Halobacillus litoralis TaxID=45668 RepID=A0A410MHI8_9BACI|nr:hypothetical protein [Halobacillus litoralis]QAS54148.1 hypothetical protein HLI_18985 [Halobacillus litoralis]
MGELFELVFSNFLILAAIIGGIISWFSGMSKEKDTKKESEKKRVPRPSTYPSGPGSDAPPERTMKSGEDRLKEYYEEKKKRSEELSGGNQETDPINAYSYDNPEDDAHTVRVHKDNGRKDAASRLIENGPLIESAKKWDKKRLAEGILMAEVLGQPRAHKPHSSHPRKR